MPSDCYARHLTFWPFLPTGNSGQRSKVLVAHVIRCYYGAVIFGLSIVRDCIAGTARSGTFLGHTLAVTGGPIGDFPIALLELVPYVAYE